MNNESSWEYLADLAEEVAYKEVLAPKRSQAQKMRDLLRDLEVENAATRSRTQKPFGG